MEAKGFLLFALFIWSTFLRNQASAIPYICNNAQCKCITNVFKGEHIINVNCSFPAENDGEAEIIPPNSMPYNVYKFEVFAGGELQLDGGSFSKLNSLRKVLVRGVKKLLVRTSAFLNLSKDFSLDIQDCRSVEFQKQAYHTRGVLTVSNAGNLKIHASAFSQLNDVVISNITLERISSEELSARTFPSSIAQIRLIDSQIGVLRRGAFSGTEFGGVTIRNCTFCAVESEAFSQRSLISHLDFIQNRVGILQRGAILSAISNFTISENLINIVESEALNMSTVAKVICENNSFEEVREKGLTFRNSMYLNIAKNIFYRVFKDGISVVTNEEPAANGDKYFAFEGNEILKSDSKFLKLQAYRNFNSTGVGNFFSFLCDCGAYSWLKEAFDADARFVESVCNGGFCIMDAALAEYPTNYDKFSPILESHRIGCEGMACQESAPPERENVPADGGGGESPVAEGMNLEKISLLASAGVFALACLAVITWCGARGFSLKGPRSKGGDSSRTASANSIARIPVHDYAKVHRGKFIPDDGDDFVECSDKGSQTLPEELTHELLKNLRENLNDPDNGGEARFMIEHLYDLIKTEEMCNNNDDALCGEIYALKFVKKRRRDYSSFKAVVHAGTRVPSPDKLLPPPFAGLNQPKCADYAEPSDRLSHIYAEPTSNGIYAEPAVANRGRRFSNGEDPIYAELLNDILKRPLS